MVYLDEDFRKKHSLEYCFTMRPICAMIYANDAGSYARAKSRAGLYQVQILARRKGDKDEDGSLRHFASLYAGEWADGF